MNGSSSILNTAFHACCFVLMRDLINQNIGDAFETPRVPNDPITKILDEMPKPPEFLIR